MTKSAKPAHGSASRAAAAQVLFEVLQNGRSLSQVIPSFTSDLDGRDRALTQQLCYGVLRFLPSLNFVLKPLLQKPFKRQQAVLNELLLVGAYQLLYLRTADHGAVSATVDASKLLGQQRVSGVINGVLRNLQRQRESVLAQLAQHAELEHNHPRWLADIIQQAYPEQAGQIFTANNQQPPLWLRINTQQHDPDHYRKLLQQAGVEFIEQSPLSSAIQLTQATDVTRLPGFAEGAVSVQDIAAQHAAWLLDAQANERILDCCAAPGGKTAHILERQPTAQVVALDSDATRLQRINENLTRLQLHAEVIHADATATANWWDGQLFDRILLDAPCSATGVIRRHPDIKWLRRASDIAELVTTQATILDALWPTLKIGGRLLYATCSILPAENSEQIKGFIARHRDAIQLATAPNGSVDWQWLPGDANGDGFYYAILEKQA